MTDLPPIICDYLCRRSLAHRRPVYLHLDRAGRIRDGGGHLADYNLDPLAVGQPVSAVFDFMEGLLPLEDDACHLACLQPQADTCIDAHIIPDHQEYWLLLLDTREDERRRRAMQQKANELALVREAQARLLARRASDSMAAIPAVTFQPEGDRKEIAVLAVGLRLAARADADDPPAALLKRLARYRRRLAVDLHAEAGLIYTQTSDTLVSLFGLLPAQADPTVQALSAALKLLRAFPPLAADQGTAGHGLRPPALGAATGEAIVGLEAGQAAAGLQALGAPLKGAPDLMQAALPGQLLIDANSFQGAGVLQKRFEPFSIDRPDREGPVYAYQRMPRP